MPTSVPPNQLTERLVIQPSSVVPGVPPFVFSAPKGWVIDEAPGALAVVRLPEEIEGFWVNTIISHDKVARAVDFKAAAAITWAKLQRSATDVVDLGERLVRFGDLVVYMRGIELTATATGRRLGQLQALFFAPVSEGGKVVDFFQIVSTAPVERVQLHTPDFLEIIGSFRFL